MKIGYPDSINFKNRCTSNILIANEHKVEKALLKVKIIYPKAFKFSEEKKNELESLSGQYSRLLKERAHDFIDETLILLRLLNFNLVK